MTRDQAHAVLNNFEPTEIVADLYDADNGLAEALTVLIPDFEYPDWDARSIGQVSRRVARIG